MFLLGATCVPARRQLALTSAVSLSATWLLLMTPPFSSTPPPPDGTLRHCPPPPGQIVQRPRRRGEGEGEVTAVLESQGRGGEGEGKREQSEKFLSAGKLSFLSPETCLPMQICLSVRCQHPRKRGGGITAFSSCLC